ncbi:hypothetical protein [Lacticaseibacillus salsurivasis]|uniref:hypothetical protein n=1 Tax=Lacticaseibacillus salsurivasis TaxID=3081441 RepID=UPI0030C76E6A
MNEAIANISILFHLDDGADFARRPPSVCTTIGVNLKPVKVFATHNVSFELIRIVVAEHPSRQVSSNKGRTREPDEGYFNNLEEQV